ncbi:MFS transporter [Verticiella sediminum]|uniref:MFS transporter n=1 Tax=Verticiella sediminum TaxID=1247510 RepID=A0A556ABC6_9BURK|nr:MFS transporter [Verticiella sediminum]
MGEPQAGQPGRPSQFALLRERRYAPFFLTQLSGALNDNLFKIAFTSLVTYQAARFGGVDPDTVAFLISAIFILPFLLFSATSGQLADKYDRAFIMRLVKRLEVAIMLVGAYGFLRYDVHALYLVTFLMGLHSTLFGPAKYAYLPQHLAPEELIGGNALVQMATFVAILAGTIAGGELARVAADRSGWIAAVCLVVAGLGLLASRRIPATPAPEPGLRINWNPFTETWRNLVMAAEERAVLVAMIAISWLWFLGATFLASFFGYARGVLYADQGVLTLLLTMFSIGIGAGALLCERLSGGRVELGLVPVGAIGMTLFAGDLYFASQGIADPGHLRTLGEFLAAGASWRILADLWLLSLFAGIYSVPLYAYIQSRCRPTHRARIIAANNILNALFMVASALAAMALLGAGVTLPGLYGLTALVNVAVAVLLCVCVPEFFTRFLAWSRLRKNV